MSAAAELRVNSDATLPEPAPTAEANADSGVGNRRAKQTGVGLAARESTKRCFFLISF